MGRESQPKQAISRLTSCLPQTHNRPGSVVGGERREVQNLIYSSIWVKAGNRYVTFSPK